PHPRVRQAGEGERLLGVADVHHDLRGQRRHRVDLGGGDRVVEDPLVHVAGVALGGGDGDLVPVGQVAGGGAGADHGRDPQFAGDDRGVAGAAAAVGDDGAGAL